MTSPLRHAFIVPGIPVAKGRPKFVRAGKFVRAFTPTKTVRFEERVRLSAEAAGVTPLEGPLELLIVALFPMRGQPLKRSRRPACWKATKPDADNLGKAVADSLNGIAYKDDGQVVRLSVVKMHAAQGQPAGTYVEVWEADPVLAEELALGIGTEPEDACGHGHPATALVSSKEGTWYCLECEDEARRAS